MQKQVTQWHQTDVLRSPMLVAESTQSLTHHRSSLFSMSLGSDGAWLH